MDYHLPPPVLEETIAHRLKDATVSGVTDFIRDKGIKVSHRVGEGAVVTFYYRDQALDPIGKVADKRYIVSIDIAI